MTTVPKDAQPSAFYRMTDIQILKHGLESNLYKKSGWLAKLLVTEGRQKLEIILADHIHMNPKQRGILDGSKQALKARCLSDYNAHMLYIDAMREAKDDETFDPRRNEHVTGKDGRFVAQKGKSIPKNPLTSFEGNWGLVQ